MSDTLRGEVSKVIDGDTFELHVLDVDSDNKDQYNSVETIRIDNFHEEIDSSFAETDAEDEFMMDADVSELVEDELTERDGSDYGRYDPTGYYGVRSKEDLEVRLEGRAVMCRVKDRDSYSEIIADVAVV